MLSQNLHTHCDFCHGYNPMEEMVLKAIDLGMESIGISCHNWAGLDFIGYSMRPESIEPYFAEIERLRGLYSDRITIYAGLEIENITSLGPTPPIDPRLDYSIGSVHFYHTPEGIKAVDSKESNFDDAAKAYGGDKHKLMESYFKDVCDFALTSKYDIAGHLDLIAKFNESTHSFDEEDPVYKSLALDCAGTVVRAGKIVELNTGAMFNGYRSTPYPARFMLEYLKQINAPIIISSDSHKPEAINWKADEMIAYLKAIGFEKRMMLTKEGFKAVKL